MLQSLLIQFEVVAPAPEAEKPLPPELPLPRLGQALVEVARSKAHDVLARCPFPCLVVAADTVVYADGRVLGKPADAAAARQQLLMLSGKSHRVLSAVTVARSGCEPHSAVETTEVRFRELSEPELDLYIATGEPLDKAGSYGIQGWAGLFVDSIQGRYDNVVGFPLVSLESLLRREGCSLYDFRTRT
jgi:septum formation protein